VRVIAGRFKGRRLVSAPKGVRPSTDRVRESLFAVLTPRLAGAYVVDLFCGTGSLGIEALSRGAVGALFVDRAPRSLAALERNLGPLQKEAPELEITVKRQEVLGFVTEAGGGWPTRGVDLVFMDPPYDDPVGPAALAALARGRGDELGLVIYESGEAEPPPPPELEVERVLRFGDTRVTLLRGGKS